MLFFAGHPLSVRPMLATPSCPCVSSSPEQMHLLPFPEAGLHAADVQTRKSSQNMSRLAGTRIASCAFQGARSFQVIWHCMERCANFCPEHKSVPFGFAVSVLGLNRGLLAFSDHGGLRESTVRPPRHVRGSGHHPRLANPGPAAESALDKLLTSLLRLIRN